jgi:hypothetical protein
MWVTDGSRQVVTDAAIEHVKEIHLSTIELCLGHLTKMLKEES